MRTPLLIFLLLISTACFSQDRNAKLRTLMEVQGLLAMFQQQMDAGKQQGRDQSKRMLDQVMSGLNPQQDFKDRLRRASDEFIAALEAPWTAQEIVDVWAKSYAASFTDKELDQLLAFYTSPLGKKDIAASHKAMPVLTGYLADRSKPVIERATAKYVADLQLIVKECKCGK